MSTPNGPQSCPPDSILTYTGRVVRPLDLDPQTIDILDIAHALACQNRFTGHLKVPFSVAQHSVLVSQHCDPSDALWGLLHDATEAYLADVARPVKHSPDFIAYRVAEERAMRVIADVFGLPWPEPASVKRADNAVLLAEKRSFGHHLRMREYGPDTLSDLKIEPLPWHGAERQFLERYMALTGSSVRIPDARDDAAERGRCRAIAGGVASLAAEGAWGDEPGTFAAMGAAELICSLIDAGVSASSVRAHLPEKVAPAFTDPKLSDARLQAIAEDPLSISKPLYEPVSVALSRELIATRVRLAAMERDARGVLVLQADGDAVTLLLGLGGRPKSVRLDLSEIDSLVKRLVELAGKIRSEVCKGPR